MSTSSDSRPDGPPWYEIRLEGRLDPRWAGRFDPMSLTTADGLTRLTGPVVDQAALHGLLHQLRDIGLTLVSVGQVEPGATSYPVAPSTPTHRPTTGA
ncbi:hypothetical protein [Nocardioides cynanchi]|uniref:hypothetical protein n=1 Tax=Nocardioides cynanchi TaxID=2558918 RepID=UPI0012454FC8|nr:hypothetical protein [Nocardioides cynanchi]